ncbi:MAG: helix-turn-helix domain-containing protein [Lentisphaerae bacterium]|nr:helix-turn-helix domain-containing protein [Lentisphaerota bacterium]
MLPFRVTSVITFRYAKKGTYVQAYHSITLSLAGLRKWHSNGVTVKDNQPFFLLSARGTEIEFDYDHQRETWGIMLDTDHWRRSKAPGMLEIRLAGKWTQLPMLTQLDQAHVPHWQQEMTLMRELFMDPLPLNSIRLELGVMGILRHVLEQHAGTTVKNTPARQLKVLLDCPDSRLRPMHELAGQTGYSAEHIRELFRAEFGISPSQYRTQRRLAEAMDCIAHTRLSVKEITYRLGFKHVSHFSSENNAAEDLKTFSEAKYLSLQGQTGNFTKNPVRVGGW